MKKPEYPTSVSQKLVSFMSIPGVRKVSGWTFMYDKWSVTDGTPYNATFFETVAGVSYSEWKSGRMPAETLVSKTDSAFLGWIGTLEEIRNDVVFSDSYPGKTEKTAIEREGIDFVVEGIRTARSAIAIELEKASASPILSESERVRLVGELESGHTAAYGGKISEDPKETALSLELLCEEFSANRERLSESETRRFLEIYRKLASRAESIHGTGSFAAPDIRDFKKRETVIHAFTKTALDGIKGVKIPRSAYMGIFQDYIDLMGTGHKTVLSRNAGNVYCGPRTLEIPHSEAYRELGLVRVLNLMVHEIGVHCANQAIGKEYAFDARGAGSVEKEEGLAIIMENLFAGECLVDSKRAGYSFPNILAGEILTKSDRRDFIRLRMKLNGRSPTPESVVVSDLRIMRGYPESGPGAQRKDASYGRGANRIASLVAGGKHSVADFFRGKFSIGDIVSGRLDGIVGKERGNLPLPLPEMLLFLFGVGKADFSYPEFLDYMNGKYGVEVPYDMGEKRSSETVAMLWKTYGDIAKHIPDPVEYGTSNFGNRPKRG